MGWKGGVESAGERVLLPMAAMSARRSEFVSSDGPGLRSPRVRTINAVLIAEKRPAYIGGTRTSVT